MTGANAETRSGGGEPRFAGDAETLGADRVSPDLQLWEGACRAQDAAWWLRPLLRQFGHPRGMLGMLVGRVMAAKSDSGRRAAWTLDRLEIGSDSRVLEIGFGPGLGLEDALRRASAGEVVGVDHSALMVRQARRRLAPWRKGERLQLVQASAERLPDLGSFSHILAINSLQFWDDPGGTVGDLVTKLLPGGRLALTFQPPWRGAGAADALSAGALMAELLRTAGLRVGDVELLPLHAAPAVCVLGERKSS